MNPISQEILESYQARRTQKQKTAFINYYVQQLAESGIETNVEKGGLLNYRNIHIGNLDKAQFVFTAHYDTAPVRILPIPKFIVFPNKTVLSLITDLLTFILFLALLTIPALLLGIEFATITRFYPALVFLAIFSGFVGPTNHHTANDNTSGVIGINEMIFALKDELDNVAFVLFDNEEKGLLGSGLFSKKHKDILEDKIIINLDCISSGDYLMIMNSDNLMQNTEYMDYLNHSFSKTPSGKQHTIEGLTYFPSDQMHFKNGAAIVACQKMSVFGRYLTDIHTSKDVVFDQKNIGYIKDSLVQLVRATSNIKLVCAPKELNFFERFWENAKPGRFIAQVLLIGIVGFLLGLFLG